jgi:hypothetical protein
MAAGSPAHPPRSKLRWLQFRLRTLLIVIIVVNCCLGYFAWKMKPSTEGPPAARKGPSGPYWLLPDAEVRIRAELKKPTQIEFNETQLKDAIDYLEQLHGINFEFDQKALIAENIALDTPITRVLKGVSLESGLQLILEDVGLAFVVDHEVLVVTTRKVAESCIRTHLYPVDDFVADDASRDSFLSFVKVDLSLAAKPAGDAGTLDDRVRLFRGLLILRGTYAEHARLQRLIETMRQALDLGAMGAWREVSPLVKPERWHTLDLTGFDLQDGDLVLLQHTTNLRHLSLKNTPITDRGLYYLSGLTRLERLDLTGTKVTNDGLRRVRMLPSLEELRLAKTAVTEDVIQWLPHGLRILDLSHTSLTGNTKGLDKIVLARRQPELTELFLDGTPVTLDFLKSWRQPSLTRLSMAKTGVKDLAFLQNLEHLQELELSGTAIADDELKHLADLKQLTTLGLDRTPLTEQALVHLSGMPQLRELHIGCAPYVDANPELGDDAVEAFQQLMPYCRVHRLARDRRRWPSEIENLKQW